MMEKKIKKQFKYYKIKIFNIFHTNYTKQIYNYIEVMKLQRKFKNILMLFLIALLGTSMYFTIDSIKNNTNEPNKITENSNMPEGTPPDMNSAPPEKPSNDNNSQADNNMDTPPEKPDNDNNSSDSSSSENQNSSDNNQIGPGNNNSEMSPPNMQDNNQNSDSNISILYLASITILPLLCLCDIYASRNSVGLLKPSILHQQSKYDSSISVLRCTDSGSPEKYSSSISNSSELFPCGDSPP